MQMSKASKGELQKSHQSKNLIFRKTLVQLLTNPQSSQ